MTKYYQQRKRWKKYYKQRKRWKIREEKETTVGKVSRDY